MRGILIIGFILCSLLSFGQNPNLETGVQRQYTIAGRTVLVWTPTDTTSFKNYNFVMSFTGNSCNDSAAAVNQGFAKRIRTDATGIHRDSFVVVTFIRQVSENSGIGSGSAIDNVIDTIIKYNKFIDTSRCHMTGLSQGAQEVIWYLSSTYQNILSYTPKHQDWFISQIYNSPGSYTESYFNDYHTTNTWISWGTADAVTGTVYPALMYTLFGTTYNFPSPKTKKIEISGAGHDATVWDSTTSLAGSTSSNNVWRWMLEVTYSPPIPPDTTTLTKIPITSAEVYNLTGYQFLTPQFLFDSDTSTVTIAPIYASTFFPNGLIAWVDLQGYYSKFRIRHNSQSGTGAVPVTIQFYKNWQDTTVKSSALTFNTAASWNTYDTLISKAITDTFSFMKITIPSVTSANKFGEIEVYGKLATGTPPSLFVTQHTTKPDRGLAFYGYGKVQLPYVTAPHYIDSTLGGMSIRWQADMDYVDTCTSCADDAHTYVLNKFEDSYTLFASRLKNNMNFSIMPYWANNSPLFDIPGVGGSNKDIPVGSDSTLNASWINQRRMARFMADSMGNLMETYEAGNEDEATWQGATRWHDPLVKLAKVHEFYYGVKESNPAYNVSLGATPFRDSTHRKAMFLQARFKYGKPNFLDSLYSVNYNHYATTGGEQGGDNTDGVSPEQDRTVELWGAMKRFNDRYFPNAYLFWTEEGYDSLASNYNVPVISGKTDLGQTIAEWILRSYDLAAVSGLDGVYQFTQTSFGGGDFASMGFVKPVETSPGSGVYINTPTRQFFYISAMKYAKVGYKGEGTIIQNGDSTGVWIIEWEHATDATKKLRSVFRGTHDNSTSSSYSMNVGAALSATTRKPTNEVIGGTTGSLSITSNSVTITTVEENPVYIELTYSGASIPTGLPRQRGKRIKWVTN